jgi:hypothetical protein
MYSQSTKPVNGRIAQAGWILDSFVSDNVHRFFSPGRSSFQEKGARKASPIALECTSGTITRNRTSSYMSLSNGVPPTKSEIEEAGATPFQTGSCLIPDSNI